MKKIRMIILFALSGLFLLAACTEENKGKYQPDEPDIPATGGQTDGVRYRGIGVSPSACAITESGVKRLGSWGVNHVRWGFEWWDISATLPVESYYNWIAQQCGALDDALPYLEQEGISVCICLFSPPRGRDATKSNAMRMFLEDDVLLQDVFIEAWKRIAAHYKGNSNIVYYDMLNEPNEGSVIPGLLNWRNLAIKTVQTIRAIDDTKKIVFEPLDGDTFQWYEPLPLSDIVYSQHIYYPHLLTHQGIISTAPLGVSYPGTIGGEYWNKGKIRDYNRHLISFIKDNNFEMYVGEFSCARWAPNNSAYNFIRDCLELFEEEGWNYAYFTDYPDASSNYGATAWSLQYDEVYQSATLVSEETNRLKLLKEYWAKNVK